MAAAVQLAVAKWEWAKPYPGRVVQAKTGTALDLDASLVERCLNGTDAACIELDKLIPGGVGAVQASFYKAGVEIQGCARFRLYHPAWVRLCPFPLGNCELYGRGHILSLLASFRSLG